MPYRQWTDEQLTDWLALPATRNFILQSLRRFGFPPHDLEDVVQDILLYATKSVHLFKRQSKPSTWLFPICKGLAVDWRRRANRRSIYKTMAEPDCESIEEPKSGPEGQTYESEYRAIVDRALDTMSSEQRKLLELSVDDVTRNEIANLLKIPPGTVASRLRRAREELMEKVRDLLNGPGSES